MSEQLKAGEYVGVDGFVRAWVPIGHQPNSPVHHHRHGDTGLWQVQRENARAAGEALIALADELEVEVVELERTESGCIYELVISPSGPHHIRWRYLTDDRTGVCNVEIGRFVLAAYRAGLAKGGQ